MKCHIYELDPRPNGTYKMSFDYIDVKHEVLINAKYIIAK
jgi:hypothetical protein